MKRTVVFAFPLLVLWIEKVQAQLDFQIAFPVAQSWSSVASDGTGTNLYACSSADGILLFDGTVYKSSNGGSSWTSCSPAGLLTPLYQWTSIATDDSGTYVSAGCNAGVWSSSNGGSTWAQTWSAANIVQVAYSGNGASCAAIYNGGIAYSNNYGQASSWVYSQSSSIANWLSIASDVTGQYWVATCSTGVYRSTNHAASWTAIAAMSGTWSICSDSTGNYLSMVDRSTGQVHVSSNAGYAWTLATTIANAFAIAADELGSILTVAANAGYIYRSCDRGNSWYIACAESQPWSSIWTDNSGLTVLSAICGSYPYLGTGSCPTAAPTKAPTKAPIALTPTAHPTAFPTTGPAAECSFNFQVALPVSQSWSGVASDGTGTNLYACSAVDSALSFVGTVYKSSNGGSSWTSLSPAGSQTSLYQWTSIATDDSGTYVSVGCNAGVWSSCNGGSTWAQTWTATNIVQVAYSGNGASCAAIYNGGIAYSNNYGQASSWVLSQGMSFENWLSIASDVTGQYWVLACSSGVYRSTTHAATWTAVAAMSGTWSICSDSTGNYLSMVDRSTGQVHVSSNAGYGWSLATTIANAFAIAADDLGSILTVAANTGYIYRSYDQGNSWLLAYAESQPWSSVWTDNAGSTIISAICGSYPYIATGGCPTAAPSASPTYTVTKVPTPHPTVFPTTGPAAECSFNFQVALPVSQSWSGVASDGTGTNLYACSAVDSALSFVGTVYKSSNGGSSWTSLSPAGSQTSLYQWTSIATDDSGTYVSVGCNAGVWSSSNGGSTWAQTWTATNIVQVAYSGNGASCAAIYNGGIAYSNNYGQASSWVLSQGMSFENWLSIASDVTGQYWVLACSSGVYRSTTHAATWTAIAAMSGTWSICSDSTGNYLSMVDRSTGQVHVSSNAGYGWSLATTIANAFAIAADDLGSILTVAANTGYIYRSYDQGNSWLLAYAESQPWSSVWTDNAGSTIISAICGSYPYIATGGCPTAAPSASPTYTVTKAPSASPTAQPSAVRTTNPTYTPSASPTYTLTKTPTANPTYTPTIHPTVFPTTVPAAECSFNFQVALPVSQSWSGVASDGTGTNLYACSAVDSALSFVGTVYKSSNGGSSWTSLSPAGSQTSLYQWTSIATDDSGTYVSVGCNAGVWSSSNGGSTWAQTWTATNIVQVAYSGNGASCAAIYNGGIAYSNNYGQASSWVLSQGMSFAAWLSIASDVTGQYWVLTCSSGVYRSTTHAATWTAIAPLAGTWSICSDSTGNYLSMVDRSTGQVQVSSNAGYGWTLATTIANAFAIAADDLGSILTVAANPGYIYRSYDNGNSWLLAYGESEAWSSVSTDNAGSTIISSIFGSYPYIGTGGCPTAAPSASPTYTVTKAPSASPTAIPTAEPSATPTAIPTATPSAHPTANPTAVPTATPTASPSDSPTAQPSANPTMVPTGSPTANPSALPTAAPTATPSAHPTAQPSTFPTTNPTYTPSAAPTYTLTKNPSTNPTYTPTIHPTVFPTTGPAAECSFNFQVALPVSESWSGVASDGTGTNLYACSAVDSALSFVGTVYKSSNGGSSWTSLSPAGSQTSLYQWTSIATDDSGTYVSVGCNAGVWSSSNGGSTWAQTWTATNIVQVAYSGNGASCAAIYNGGIAYSNNYGQASSWVLSQGMSFAAWLSIASDVTGQYWVLTCSSGVYRSTTHAATWTAIAPLTGTWSICSDSTGNYLAMVDRSTGQVQVSSNAGYGWTLATTIANAFAIAAYDLGSILTVAANPGYIYRSYDNGNSWLLAYGESQPWSSVSTDNAGSTIISSIFGSYPYIGTGGCPTAAPSASPTYTVTKAPSASPTAIPTAEPSATPTAIPTATPSAHPTANPTAVPTATPTASPSDSPTAQPSANPTTVPSAVPTAVPTATPTASPSNSPTAQPSVNPTVSPSGGPTANPTTVPSPVPTAVPTATPTASPSDSPTAQPSANPTVSPSGGPTANPTTVPSAMPTAVPTATPTLSPSDSPTAQPSVNPTVSPSGGPTANPTTVPSAVPTAVPTATPTASPSNSPTAQPSVNPTVSPSGGPTANPTTVPSPVPTAVVPTATPTASPSDSPTAQPSANPTTVPSAVPTAVPTATPTASPSNSPTAQPSVNPTVSPSGGPTANPTTVPSPVPTAVPTATPTVSPSDSPTAQPSANPTVPPSGGPTANPTTVPSAVPTAVPTATPTASPSNSPTAQPSVNPSVSPSGGPTANPTTVPSAVPTAVPKATPTVSPSDSPTAQPSANRTVPPSGGPTANPTTVPSAVPTAPTTTTPTATQSANPTATESAHPTAVPSGAPTRTVTTTFVPSQVPVNCNLPNTGGSPSNGELSLVYYSIESGGNFLVGGCIDWLAFLRYDLQFNVDNPTYESITIVSVEDVQMSKASPITCSEETIVSSIIDSLINPTISLQSFSCSGSEWKVQLCGNNEPAICVNCANPCITTGSTSYYINPCSGEASQLPQYTLITIEAVEQIPPASIIDVTVDVSRTGATVDVITTGAGLVACAVELKGENSVTSVQSIWEQRTFGLVDEFNTVHLSFTGLEPSQTYELYCLTQNLIGNTLSWSAIAANSTFFTTLCCQEIYFQIEDTLFLVGETSVDTVYLDIPFSSQLLQHKQYITVLGSFIPLQSGVEQLVFNETYLLEVGRINIPITRQMTLNVGNIKFSLVLASNNVTVIFETLSKSEPALVSRSGGKYYFSSDISIDVSSVEEDCGIPRVVEAVLSSNGEEVLIKFSQDTDEGQLSSTLFPCTSLVQFPGAGSALCVWSNNHTLVIQDSTLVIGSRVTLLGGKIKSGCEGLSAAVCEQLPFVDSASIFVTAPKAEELEIPFVSITSSRVIKLGEGAVLDISLSTGSGGRSWKTIDALVISCLPNALQLTRYLQQQIHSKSEIWFIPSSYLLEGSYYFWIRLCNFLGACGVGFHEVIVTTANVPAVWSLNPTSAKVYRRAALEVVLANVSSVSDVQISWKVISNGFPIELKSSTSYGGLFRLPPYSLLVNQVYTIVATLYDPTSGNVNEALYSVFVTAGEIHAVINGGSLQLVRAGDYLTIDGTHSYDDDIDKNIRTGSSAGLAYEWNCYQELPYASTSCGLVVVSSTTSPTLLLSAVATEIGLTSLVILTVRDYSGRVSTAEVRVKVVAATWPAINFDISDVTRTENKVKVVVAGALPQGYVQWDLNDTSIILPQIALTALSEEIVGSSVLQHYYLSLLTSGPLSGSWLQGYSVGLSFQFSGNGYVQETITLSISSNRPPNAGQFTISPTEGLNTVDIFQFFASNWEDENLPLDFLFEYEIALNSTSGYLPIQLKSGRSTAVKTFILDADLFAGSSSNSATVAVNCRVTVYDAYLASSDASGQIALFSRSSSANSNTAAISILQTIGYLPYSNEINGLSNALQLSVSPASTSPTQWLSWLYTVSPKYFVDKVNLNIWTQYLTLIMRHVSATDTANVERGLFLASYYLSQYSLLDINYESIESYFSIYSTFLTGINLLAYDAQSALNENRYRSYLDHIVLQDIVPGQAAIALYEPAFSAYYFALELQDLTVTKTIDNSLAITFSPISASSYAPVKFGFWTFYNKRLSFASSTGVVVSYPNHVTIQDWGNCAVHGCNVELTIQNINPQSYNSTQTASQTVQCYYHTAQQYSVSCPGSENVVVTCDGTYQGQVEVTCPYQSTVPVCTSVSSANSINPEIAACVVSTFSSTSTQCNCRVGKAAVGTKSCGDNDDDFSRSNINLPSVPASDSRYSFEVVVVKVQKQTKAGIVYLGSSVKPSNAANPAVSTIGQQNTIVGTVSQSSFPIITTTVRSWYTIRNIQDPALAASFNSVFEAALFDLLASWNLTSQVESLDFINSTSVIQNNANNVVILLEATLNFTSFCTVQQAYDFYHNIIRASVHNGPVFENAVKESALMISENNPLIASKVTGVFSILRSSSVVATANSTEYCQFIAQNGGGSSVDDDGPPIWNDPVITTQSNGGVSSSSSDNSVNGQLIRFFSSSEGFWFAIGFISILLILIGIATYLLYTRPEARARLRRFFGLSDNSQEKKLRELPLEKLSEIQDSSIATDEDRDSSSLLSSNQDSFISSPVRTDENSASLYAPPLPANLAVEFHRKKSFRNVKDFVADDTGSVSTAGSISLGSKTLLKSVGSKHSGDSSVEEKEFRN